MPEAVGRIGVDLATGWLPDYPDYRDFGLDQAELSDAAKKAKEKDSVSTMLKAVGVGDAAEAALPPKVDNLKQYFSPIESQASLGSCTAHAGVGLVEYFERRALNRHIDASRLFLYKVTRNLMHLTGDTGAYLRSTMGAMVLFGVPPEEYWPYDIPKFDNEPPAFCYAFAQNYQAIQYFRLDVPGTTPAQLLQKIKLLLAYGLPSMFGFTVFSSYVQAGTTGEIPYPFTGDRRVGGHAIVAAGYDDGKTIKNAAPGAKPTKGALFIRNSWGTGWGKGGYGWLPYDYVLKQLAVDWWCLLRNEWVDKGKFKLAT